MRKAIKSFFWNRKNLYHVYWRDIRDSTFINLCYKPAIDYQHPSFLRESASAIGTERSKQVLYISNSAGHNVTGQYPENFRQTGFFVLDILLQRHKME